MLKRKYLQQLSSLNNSDSFSFKLSLTYWKSPINVGIVSNEFSKLSSFSQKNDESKTVLDSLTLQLIIMMSKNDMKDILFIIMVPNG